ncbi:MAG TPA: hypothetical protein QGF58_20750 [Myxococcota bacterium]|nr:hypothetical protein [Myxococcota bacterium]
MKRLAIPSVIALIAGFALACGGEESVEEPEVILIPVPVEKPEKEIKADDPEEEVVEEEVVEEEVEVKTMEERREALGDNLDAHDIGTTGGAVKGPATGQGSAVKGGTTSSGTTKKTTSSSSKKTSSGSSGSNTAGSGAKKK